MHDANITTTAAVVLSPVLAFQCVEGGGGRIDEVLTYDVSPMNGIDFLYYFLPFLPLLYFL